MKFNYSLIVDNLPRLLEGAAITLWISILGILIGALTGLVLAFFRLGNIKVLDWLARIHINLIRGVPFLIQIFILYYGLAAIGIELSAFFSGMLAMAINTSAFQAEIYRSGIASIPKGQFEAAQALGLPKPLTMLNLIIPQVFTKVLPSLTNEFIIVLKNSSLVSVIGVVELTRVGRQIVSTTYSPAEIYITVGIIYLIMNLAIAFLAKYFEGRLSVHRGVAK